MAKLLVPILVSVLLFLISQTGHCKDSEEQQCNCCAQCESHENFYFVLFGAIGLLFEICLVCYLSKNCRRKDADREKKALAESLKFAKYFEAYDLLIKPSQVDIGQERLGVGQFAEVRKGTASFFQNSNAMHNYRQRLVTITTENVAIKITYAGKGAEIKLLEEAQRLHKIQHEHIIRLRAVCVRSLDGPLMIMELLDGNLEDYLELVRKKERPPVKLVDALRIIIQVAEAMNHLQCYGIVHRDLAARNVLLTRMDDISQAHIRLADFGLARMIPQESATYPVHDCFLPVALVPPEVFRFDRFCLKSDVWGFAVFVCEFLMVGLPPNSGRSAEQIRDAVLSEYESVRCLPQPNACPDLLYSLLKLCWALEPDDRPNFRHSAENPHDTAIIPQLQVLHFFLSQSSQRPIFLSTDTREAADTLSPLSTRSSRFYLPTPEPLEPAPGPSQEMNHSRDSGCGDSANTSRQSDQFDSLPKISELSAESAASNLHRGSNYLITRRMASAMGQSPSYDNPAFDGYNRLRSISLDSAGSRRESQEHYDAVATGRASGHPANMGLEPHFEVVGSVDSGRSGRYENWYYAQQTMRLNQLDK